MLCRMELREVGQAVKRRRDELGWSQEELARRAEVSHSYISKLEGGKLRRPGAGTLHDIAVSLGYKSVDGLLTGESAALPSESPVLSPRPWGRRLSPQELERMMPMAEDVRQLEIARAAQPHRRAEQLPIYQVLADDNPLADEPPTPFTLEHPPVGRESLIGARGFGILITEEGRWRGLISGDICWVNPDRPVVKGRLSAFYRTDKWSPNIEGGTLYVADDASDMTANTVSTSILELGPVVLITRHLQPEARSKRQHRGPAGSRQTGAELAERWMLLSPEAQEKVLEILDRYTLAQSPTAPDAPSS